MIRLLQRSDAESYRNLRLQALHTDPQVFLSTFDVEHQKPLSNFEYELSVAIAKPCFGYYGLFDNQGDNQKLIGFCQCSPSYVSKQQHVAFLYNLYVDPTYRNQGNARQLITHILKLVKNNAIEVVLVSHIASNIKAHALYISLGFKQIGQRLKSVKWDGVYDDEVELELLLTK